ncbi:hypothetical protein BH11PSE3_BH11PSE3_34570 [soil metagenome]
MTQLLVAIGDRPRRIDVDGRGKPVIRGASAPHISISHTRSTIAVAASTVGPVGIDVEYRDPDRDLNRLAAAAFGIAERRAVVAHGASAFYRIWTLREAISKATGDGMAFVTDGVDRVPIAVADGILVATGDGWLVAHHTLQPELSLALAVRAPIGPITAALQALGLAGLRLDVPA